MYLLYLESLGNPADHAVPSCHMSSMAIICSEAFEAPARRVLLDLKFRSLFWTHIRPGKTIVSLGVETENSNSNESHTLSLSRCRLCLPITWLLTLGTLPLDSSHTFNLPPTNSRESHSNVFLESSLPQQYAIFWILQSPSPLPTTFCPATPCFAKRIPR